MNYRDTIEYREYWLSYNRDSKNKYFELKNLWGCRPNSNYLPASIMLGESITHVQNTRQLHSVQTHQTCACSCVCTCTHPHTAQHTLSLSHTHTHTHTTHTHTHTHTLHAQQAYTQDRHTAPWTVIHIIDKGILLKIPSCV